MIIELFFLFAVCLAASHTTPLESSSRNVGHRIVFNLYNREHPRDPVRLEPTLESVLTAQVEFRPKTAIIVYGYGSNFNDPTPVLKDVFLSTEDVNVIVVDYSFYALQSYRNAVAAAPSVGYAIAELLKVLVNLNQVSLNRVHLIGFELGAHVVGHTGRALNGEVSRITGLDLISYRWGSSDRLRKTDGVYVEVFHTDTTNGIREAIGDVDFYPNGGGNQPGCRWWICRVRRS